MNLTALEGFEWDAGNSAKNWQKHRVSNSECEEAFFNKPLLIAEDIGHSQVEPRLFALGRSNAGRLLFVAFTLRGNRIRVISARDMSRKERVVNGKADT